ncbi:MAG: hypothetical protein RLZZ399_1196 [Verrucomicrobiota bacterium]|jgi:hypothetical protein
MGKQYNKIEKRRRRNAYIARKAAKAKELASKPKARRSARKTEAAAS